MRQITLFTSFSPNIGGGSALLRSLLPHLRKAEIRWLYLGNDGSNYPGSLLLGPPLIGGELLGDLVRSGALWTSTNSQAVSRYATAVSETSADVYWVVAANEGILLANALAKKTRVPIHLSVHDDPAAAARRSRRYRIYEGLINRAFQKALRSVGSVDVVTEAMQHYYLDEFRVNSRVVRPFLPALAPAAEFIATAAGIVVGFCGNLYAEKEMVQFCSALHRYGLDKGLRTEIRIFGETVKGELLRKRFPAMIVSRPTLPEPLLIQELSQCDFLYAMYPFSQSAELFRRTSVQQKVTVYLQAQRPIFAHTPTDSSLATAVNHYKLGVVCSSNIPAEIQQAIENLRAKSIHNHDYADAREKMYGGHNILVLAECLGVPILDQEVPA